MVDGELLEGRRLAEVADASKAQHALKVARIKPRGQGKKGKGGAQPAAGGGDGGVAGGQRASGVRVRFREVTLRKTSPSDSIGVQFHRSEADFDMSAFGTFEDGARPIIKKVSARARRVSERGPPRRLPLTLPTPPDFSCPPPRRRWSPTRWARARAWLLATWCSR